MLALHLFFAGLWPILLAESVPILLIAACLALAYFSPIWKVDFLWAAACIAVWLFAVNHGIKLEKARRDAEAQVIQADVNAVVKKITTPQAQADKDPWDSPKN